MRVESRFRVLVLGSGFWCSMRNRLVSSCNSLGMYILNRVGVRHFLSLWWPCVLISAASFAESRLNFPRLANESGTITGVAIVNPRDEAATIQVTAYLEDGRILAGEGIQNPVEMIIEGKQQLAIPSQGVQRLEVGDLFALDASADTSFFYLTVTANTDIACFELVKGPGDLLGLNAVPIDEPVNHILFPQMAVLGGLESRLTLSSASEEAVIVTITAHKPDGALYDQEDLQTNPVDRVIQPPGAPQRGSGKDVWVLRSGDTGRLAPD